MADWNVGDLALCVRSGPIETPYVIWMGAGLVRGKVYEVEAVGLDTDPLDEVVVLFLKGDTHEGGEGRAEERFIKVTPPEADAFDRETIALLTGAGQEVGA